MKNKKAIGNSKKKIEAVDDCCALCKLMEDGEGGDYEKLKKGFAEMAMRANIDKDSGITVGVMSNPKGSIGKKK
jgi:hypothetical protein